ncbi:MAG: CDGSH iron-sulfur domain-containing protein [Actinomycetota bacterium]|nr:CDGSH iron-sulfur domain-containing protein [Actinomycetota bacterium]
MDDAEGVADLRRRNENRFDGCVITPYPDGPYLVRGAFKITNENGDEIEVRRKTVALCRCGASGIKPWCDGTHKLIRFKAPSVEPASPDEEGVA